MENFLNDFLNSDLSLIDFCKKNNLSRLEFERFINDHGYYWKRKRNGKMVKNYKDAIDYYLSNNYSCSVVAKKFNLNSQSLKTELEEKNLYDDSKSRLREKKYNEHIFDIIDTEEKAYWLGFIFADGYIYSAPLNKIEGRIDYNFELCSKGEDNVHMQKFAKFIGYEKELKVTKADNYGHTRCRICLSSKHLWETLNSLGCTPNKSLTLTFPDIKIFKNYNLVFDFIRGYVDGDGWISYCDKDHNDMCWGFLGTEEFVNSVQSVLGSNLNIHHNHDNLQESTMKILYRMKSGLFFLHKLYKNATVYLERKFNKYLEYCRLYEESYKELETNIGESCDANPEITEESNESSASYSVETETEQSE